MKPRHWVAFRSLHTTAASASNQHAAKLINSLINYIGAKNPIQRRFAERAVADLSEDERREFDSYLEFWLLSGATIAMIGNGDNAIVQNMTSEKFLFKGHKRYRHSRYKHAAKAVCYSRDYVQMAWL
jgi:ABC-type uncharacterized transport system involved in gliding motility auxiliary subunit